MEYPSLSTPPAGSIRFNTETKKLEIYNGDKWWEIDSTSPEVHTGGTRGIWGGGEAPGATDVIQYINVNTTGNAVDFGNLTSNQSEKSSTASRTRGIFFTSSPGGDKNSIEFVTIASTGNATNFGDMIGDYSQRAGASDGSRGLVMGGLLAPGTAKNDIEYITIAATGNAVDFGDMTTARIAIATVNSPTRAVIGSGSQAGSPYLENTIDFVTIATTGNAADFGDPVVGMKGLASASNAVRGVFGGGRSAVPGQTDSNTMTYVTMATLGNSIDFGDLSQPRAGLSGNCASPIRGVFGGGYYWAQPSGTYTRADNIDYIQFASTGNATDFGNLLAGNQYCTSLSNGHGGLG